MEIVRSTSDDWTYLLNWVREAEYKRYVTGPLSEKVIYSGLFISYKNSLFILRRQGFPAGFIELYNRDESSGVISLNLYTARSCRTGLLSMEGLIGALSLGFKSDEIRKISFYVASSNIPMKKVLSRLEFFRREGLLRCKMTDADLEIYSIFREEYEELLQRKTVRRILSNLKFEV